MNKIQQKVPTILTLCLMLGVVYNTLDASSTVKTKTIILELADGQEYSVSRKDVKELALLSKSGIFDLSADKVSLHALTKVGFEVLVANLAVIKMGGKYLQQGLFRDYFADKQAAEIVECRKRLESGDDLGLTLLKSARCLGIESVQIAFKEYLRLAAALKNHRSHSKDLRPLYPSGRQLVTQASEEECGPDCPICLENHEERHEQEEALTCNHVFGKACIEEWEKTSPYKDCPTCRAAISYKATGICALCNDPIDMREPSCTYECEYRGYTESKPTWLKPWELLTTWKKERHFFHERCIASYARRAAVRSQENFLQINNGDIIFHCPIRHKHGSPNTKTDLKVPLSKVMPIIQFKNESFPTMDSVQKGCEICHREIEWYQKSSSYPCRWLPSASGGHSEKVHRFHEKCLKPLAERTAYKHEDGKCYFFCPVDHDGAARLDELVIPLLEGFIPDHIESKCGICRMKLDENDPEVQLIEFNGYSASGDFIREKTWYHDKCFGAFLARTASKKETWWTGEVKYVYPCPIHEGTPRAHEFVLSHHAVTEAGK